jgi:hypothetical protein
LYLCSLELKNVFHIADDGKLDTESDSGEFWVLFGGFAPIGKKVISEDDIVPETIPAQLYRYVNFILVTPLLLHLHSQITCFEKII